MLRTARSRFFAVGFIVALMAVLAACGGSNSVAEAPATPTDTPRADATPTATSLPLAPTSTPRATPTPLPTSTPIPDWQVRWDETVAKACEEGEIFVQGPAEVRERTLFTEIFTADFPCIEVKYSGIRARSWLPKIEAERGANVYNWDLYLVSGAGSGRAGWRAGFYDPLKPILILPEVLDESKWRGGFDRGWLDTDGAYLYNAVEGVNTLQVQYNKDLVSADEFSKIEDLLKPKFKGKILSDDPRARGPGNGANATLFASFGEQFLRDLWEGQEVSISRDVRALLEDVIRGQAMIGIGLDQPLPAFQAEGVGTNIVNLELEVPVGLTSGSRGQVALIKNAPHPNAAAVMANWYMSQRIQQLHVDRYAADKETRVSRRLDVTSYCASGTESCIPQEGAEYVNYDMEVHANIRNDATAIAKSIFGN
jgi:iron(III) transport system substrate-binding protein